MGSFNGRKSREGAAVIQNDALFNANGQGHDGTGFTTSATLRFKVDGSVSTGVVPGRMEFDVRDTAGVNIKAMTIKASGNVGINNIIPTNRLHVSDTQDPLRLEGLRDSVAATNKLLVADANGVVYEAAVADVLAASDVDEWVDGDSLGIAGLVYARQALANGDTVVVTDNGSLLVNTAEAKASMTVV